MYENKMEDRHLIDKEHHSYGYEGGHAWWEKSVGGRSFNGKKRIVGGRVFTGRRSIHG